MRYALERMYDKYYILDRKQGDRKEIDAKLHAEIEARYPAKEFDHFPKDEEKSEKTHKVEKSEKSEKTHKSEK